MKAEWVVDFTPLDLQQERSCCEWSNGSRADNEGIGKPSMDQQLSVCKQTTPTSGDTKMLRWRKLFFVKRSVLKEGSLGTPTTPSWLTCSPEKRCYYPPCCQEYYIQGAQNFFLKKIEFISSFFPLILVDSENLIVANSLVTLNHIQPEWYYPFSYMWFYA